MKGKDFIGRARQYARTRGLEFAHDTRQGKGSHTMIRVGQFRTVVKNGEIGKSLFNRMLKQLRIDKEDF